MRYPVTLRTILFLATLASPPLLRAVEVDVDEDAPLPAGAVKDVGTRQAAPEVAEASDEAAQSLKRIQVPAGLELKLWAAEPMLANPVAFNFDERGRIFVAETYRYRTSVLDIRDYMWMLEEDLASRSIEDRTAILQKRFGPAGIKELSLESELVRLVEDTNGDGVADRSGVYADGFNSPLDGIASGVLARRGQVWFTNIPSVWQFTGAQKAETRTELSRGYGVRFNFTGHDLHGLVFGPDGKIYFSVGDRGANVRTKEGGVVAAIDTGSVFRSNPDGTQLELFATGLRNPQSLVFTENGDLFTGDNDSDAGDEERLVHVVEGGDSGWRIGYQFAPLEKGGPWNTEKLWHQRHPGQPAYFLPPICNIEDGPSGIAYYPGTGLSPGYAGTLFITHFKGAIARSGIYTYNLKPKGASYEVADAKPFITSALPTDVKFGPDGRLYFSDWADGWPKSKRGRIYALSDPRHAGDALVKETQQLIASDWTKKSVADLTRLLAHPDWRVRLEAQYALAERNDEGLPALRSVAEDAQAPVRARLHAIWGLGQLAERNPLAAVPFLACVADAEPEVRAQALKMIGDHHRGGQPPEDFLAGLPRFLGDASARVKFFAAHALGKVALSHPALAEPASRALLGALRANNDEDHYLRHAFVLALARAKHLPTLTGAIGDESVAVRRGVLLALRRLARPEIERFLADADPGIVREAAIAINDEPINGALPALAALIDHPTTDESVLFRVLNAQFRLGEATHARALAAYALRTEAPAKLRAEALTQLGLWAKPPRRDRIVGVFRPLTGPAHERAAAVEAITPAVPALLARETPAVVQTAALKALQALEVAGASDALFAAVKDEEQPPAARAAALEALDKLNDPRLAEAVAIGGASRASVLRLAALPIAARLSPEASAPVLANLIAHGSTTEQKTAYRALGNLKHPSADTLLAEQLRQLAAGKVAPAVQLELVTAAGRREDPAVKALLEEREKALAASGDPLAPFRVALAGGDRKRGERIFQNQPTLACIRCHRAGSDGGDAGPNLAECGMKYSREYLLESIIKPNAKIAPGFDTLVLTLKGGGIAAGVVTAETDTAITLRDPENKTVEIRKADITRREGAPSSMPEIYGGILTKAQVRDLVEYLAGLKSKPDRIDANQPRALRGFPPPPKPAATED